MKKVTLLIAVLFIVSLTLSGIAYAGDFYSDKDTMFLFNKKVGDKPSTHVKFLGSKKGCQGCAGCTAACASKKAGEPAQVAAPEKKFRCGCTGENYDKPCHKMNFKKFKCHGACKMTQKCDACSNKVQKQAGCNCGNAECKGCAPMTAPACHYNCKAGKTTCDCHRFHRVKGERACPVLNCACDCHTQHTTGDCHEVNCKCSCHNLQKGL